MKTLKIKPINEVVLEERNAICSFCGEDAICIKGEDVSLTYQIPVTKMMRVAENTERKRIINDYKTGFFGGKYIIGDWHYEDVVKNVQYEHVIERYEEKTTSDSADICKNCIKNLYNLTK